MSVSLKVALGAGLPFGLLMGLVMGLTRGPTGLGLGLASGLVFGAAMAMVVARQTRLLHEKFGLSHEGEPLVRRGVANHQKNIEARGGYLLLTNSRLTFIAHKMNVQTDGVSLPLDSIAWAKAGRSLGIIPNQLRVGLRDGSEHKFVVWGNQEWVRRINERCS